MPQVKTLATLIKPLSGKSHFCPCGTDVPAELAIEHDGTFYCSLTCRDDYARPDDDAETDLLTESLRAALVAMDNEDRAPVRTADHERADREALRGLGLAERWGRENGTGNYLYCITQTGRDALQAQ